MKDMLSEAICLAAQAHHGQVDKAGQPYILHPVRVMIKLRDNTGDQAVAVLHDVVEDTGYSFSRCASCLNEELMEALRCLTRRENEPYDEYIDRICTNKRACRIKLADLEDNMDLSRLEAVTDKDKLRYGKYQKAHSKISFKLSEWDR
jgi:(p)ppGpp synthase/HD superfamily hydrolase